MVNFRGYILFLFKPPKFDICATKFLFLLPVERLAEKWEAKRKSLIAVATNGSFDFEDGPGGAQEVI